MIAHTLLSWLKITPYGNWRSIQRNIICTYLVFFLQIADAHGDGGKKIVLLMSEDTQVYSTVARHTVQGIQKKCPHTLPVCHEIILMNSVSGKPLEIPENDIDILITFGTKAASDRIAKAFTHDIILAMIPRQGRLATGDHLASEKVTKIYIDQPYARYFSLIKAVLPRAMRIGVLLHAADAHRIEALQDAANSAGLMLKTGLVESSNEIGESLSHLLGGIDTLLALPDSRIHNSKTISNILTTSYRNHIPVIAFSSAYVKAGATAAVYTSLADIADQVSDIAVEILAEGETRTRDLPAKYFSVSLNFEVSRSLGISATSPSEIIESMNQELSE